MKRRIVATLGAVLLSLLFLIWDLRSSSAARNLKISPPPAAPTQQGRESPYPASTAEHTSHVSTGLRPEAARDSYQRAPVPDSTSAPAAGSIGAPAQASAGLKINATFDSSITTDPNAAAIETAINNAIGTLQALYRDALTVNISFRYSANDVSENPLGGLSQSYYVIYPIPWDTFVNALKVQASTANDSTANASLPGSALATNIIPSSANGRAVGLNTPPAMFANGSVGAGGPYDGIVTLNSSQPFQFTRPPSGGNFDAQLAAEHEIDEVLGLGSFRNCGYCINNNSLRPQDLFSWSSAGTRSTFTSGTRYFSIDGGATNIVGFNQTDGYDFGDWFSEPCPQTHLYVQNAFICVGESSDVTATSPEGVNLDVIGYDLVIPAATVQFNSITYNISEAGGSAIITVLRNGNTSGTSMVDYATSDGTALQRTDYNFAAGTLTFNPGDTAKTFSVPVVDDAYINGIRSLNLTLSNAVGAGLGIPSTATLTIMDDDSPGSITPVPERFLAALMTGQETPPPSNNCAAGPTCPRGTGLVLLSQDQATAQVGLVYTYLSSAETAADIDSGAIGVAGQSIFAPPTTNPVVNAQFSPTTQQEADLRAGLHYINVHSSNLPNGEIRGQLLWNPTLEGKFFVRQHYLDFLNREPDPSGLGYWTGQISSTQGDVQAFHDHTIVVSDAFFFEPEFQQTAGFVFRMYRAAFGNNQPFPNPDTSNATEADKIPDYSVFATDRARVLGGSDLAPAQLAFATRFVARPQFIAMYSPSLTGPQFVAAVLSTIQAADSVDLSSQTATLITHYNNGGRPLVMWHLVNDYWNGCGSNPTPCIPPGFGTPVDNRPFIDAEYNRQFALTLYFGYLRRNPDIGGFLFWQGQVNSAPVRNVPKQQALVCSFMTSAEYQDRFGPHVQVSGVSYYPRTNRECPQ